MELEKLKVVAEGLGWTELEIVTLGEYLLGIPPDCAMHKVFEPRKEVANLIDKFKPDMEWQFIDDNYAWEIDMFGSEEEDYPCVATGSNVDFVEALLSCIYDYLV